MDSNISDPGELCHSLLAFEWRKQYNASTSYIDSVAQDVMQVYGLKLGNQRLILMVVFILAQ